MPLGPLVYWKNIPHISSSVIVILEADMINYLRQAPKKMYELASHSKSNACII